MKAVRMEKAGCWEKTAPGAESLTVLELVSVTSLDIASYLFSVCHWVLLLGFFGLRNKKKKAKEKYNPNDSSTGIRAAPLLRTPTANLP